MTVHSQLFWPLQTVISIMPEQLNSSSAGKCSHPADPAAAAACTQASQAGSTGQKDSPHPPACFAFTSDLWIYLIFFPILLILLHSWHWSYFILRAQKSVMEDLDGSASLYFYWSVSENTFTMIIITSFSWISSAYLASLIFQRNWWIECCFTIKC